MTPLSILKQMIIEEKRKQNPNIPERYLFADTFELSKPEKREKRRIEKFLLLKGHYAAIIENRGFRKSTKTTVFWDEGVGREIGEVTYQKSGMRKGIADIKATIKGKAIDIELKRIYEKGKDKQSNSQIKEQKLIETAGGIYVIVSSFDDFFRWYENNIEKL